MERRAVVFQVHTSNFSISDASELLPGSKLLEMVSNTVAAELGKEQKEVMGRFSVHRPSVHPLLYSNTLPPPGVHLLFAVLWLLRFSKTALYPLTQLPRDYAFLLLHIYRNCPATEVLTPVFLSFQYFPHFGIISMCSEEGDKCTWSTHHLSMTFMVRTSHST